MAAGLPLPSIDENISTTLSSGITDVAGSMDVGDATKIPGVCYLVIDRVDSAGNLKQTSLWEYVKVTNVAGQTLTISRGQGGSTAQAHGSGAVVEAVVTSSMFEDWYAALNPEHTATGGHVINTATITNAVITNEIVGTMTVAGMNLVSVATIASTGIGIARVLTYLNCSGASITGTFPVSYPSGASGAQLVSQGVGVNPAYVVNPAFSVYLNSNLSIASGSFAKVKFDTEYFDTNANFDSSTNFRFVPTVAGNYLISSGIVCQSPGSGTMLQLSVYLNNNAINTVRNQAGASNDGVNITTIVPMNGSSDYVEVFFSQDSGVSKLLATGQALAWATGCRIG